MGSGARLAVFDRRRAGVLLPLSALPAALGRGGRAFIDWLQSAGFTVWQVLPVGPTGADGSPYWVRSDHAGNPALLDPLELPSPQDAQAAQFLAGSSAWLTDYALFEALERAHGGAAFWRWPAPLRDREPQALARAQQELAPQIERIRHEQYAFQVQWQALRRYAHERNVRLFGDLPFYVAPSSAETWRHRGLFQLRADGEPAAIGGVPPDYFSPTGQSWGNPLYDWGAMAAQDFAWWRARLAAQLARLDLLRLDHFRALAAHWAVPADAPDARSGAWMPSPGEALLAGLRGECSELPLVAEDLGVITEDVSALMRSFGLPGMRVLQFGFDGNPSNPHLPYQYPRECVAYTGTHDNDTALGWYRSLDAGTRARVDLFLDARGAMPEPALRAVLGSVAQLAVLPLQDLLGLGSAARFNTPGTVTGNWHWQVPQGALTAELAAHSARLNAIFGRS
ncbi:MAG: 4-alpha-glucanotransferase [Proteobacteria bacterium]|nr:4-alpha-glucanotransferase [Pseudomonadota bacterium]